MDAAHDRVVAHVRGQAAACRYLGSELYAGLLERIASDIELGGPAWRVFAPFADWRDGSVYALRVMGIVNRLVLEGRAPELAPHFAPGGHPASAWPVLRALFDERGAEIARMALDRGVQTNEVGRAAALAPALLHLARGLPLRLLEVGASAGLNLCFDAYRYEDLWGPPESPVRLVNRYDGEPPPFPDDPIRVVERRGCDLNPVDVTVEEGRVTLLSYVWADDAERVGLLDGAIRVARQARVRLDRAPAGEWLGTMLDEAPQPGVATVVFHSIVMQYLPRDERDRVERTIRDAGARATEARPLAWLRMEPDGEVARVDCVSWPGGEQRALARAGYHGRPVRWLGG